MKLDLNEIKYIRQSLQFRANHYAEKPEFKKYFNEVKKIIKKFILLEEKTQGRKVVDCTKLNARLNNTKFN